MVRTLTDTLVQTLGQAVAEMIVNLLPLIVLLLLSLPVYFLLKKLGFGRQNTTFREDVREAIAWRPGAAGYARNPMARELNTAGVYLRTVFQYLLAGVLVLATVFIVWFFATIRHETERQFLQMYFGIGYLILVAMIVGKIFALQHEKRGKRRIEDQAARITSDFGTLEPHVLQTAKIHLDVGGPLESVCAMAHQHYSRWPDSQRRAFETWLLSQIQTALEHEGTLAPGASPVHATVITGQAPVEQFQAPVMASETQAQPFQAPVMATEPHTPQFEPPVMASQPAAQPSLTAKQITILAIVFVLALAGFTTLWLFVRIR